ncbi:hypothetical protein SAMN05428944_0088 [Streptomyces sp. 1222.5]|uniref:hypothetical protein n=1 Tax=unclassified Streptomyces TaxID=2593676 RepID=UPI0008975EBA|nr:MULTISPECIES: hypothetical protein [unclassified Streptomyces]PKW05023.1 hypothetical protein BX260_0085 [Streptomyces sp. 5112.2]SEB53435.1 hypothetical protein SAMN05428944_0088 [Streptomyces sp. 1222.5]
MGKILDSPGIPNDDPRLRSRAAKHSNERSRLILAVSWLALLYAVALGIAASTDPGALLGLILLVVVVGFWLLMPLWNARLLGRAVKVTPESSQSFTPRSSVCRQCSTTTGPSTSACTAAMNPAEFERFRADSTDKGRQLLNRLLMLSPHQHHCSTT